jgi:PAS domain S-box-containing protein
MASEPPFFTALADKARRSIPRWLQHGRHPWQRYGMAMVLTVLAVWLRMALAPADTGGRYITASLAVALSALYGGFGAGLFSTVFGMVLVNFFMVEPYLSMAIANPTEAFWLNAWHLITQLVVIGAICVMQTQYRRLREAHQEAQLNQRRFLDTFEHAAAGISHVALDGRLMRVNQTFCQLVGYTEAELLRLDFQTITHADDVAPDTALQQQTFSGQRTSYALEKRYIHKDGHTVWAQLTVALMRHPDGSPDYFISVVQDISGVKATEAALRTSERLMRQAQTLAGFASWEADVATLQFHAAGGSHLRLGLPSAAFAGQQLMELVHPDDKARFWSDWVLALQGQREYNTSYRALVNGEDRWFSVRAEFERDANGRAVRAFGVTQDITQRTQTELEVQRLNASLEHRIQERTRELKGAYDDLESYSYAVAHDLRSPLRIINGFAQALQEDQPALDVASRGHLSRIMAASKKMGELIDGLLQLSQYARGEVQRVPVSLSGIATRQLEELAAADPGRRVTCTVEPDIEIQADPALIEALMQNLLHNAWKYTAEVPDALIRVFTQDADGQRHYCVNDNGAGFDMARADKLFQPFQRLHQAHEFAGLGIGLATARRIVQRHGGTMRAEGAPGQGATFCFTLPDGVE